MEEDGDCNIRVICRFRPINSREREEGADIMANQLKFTGDHTIEVAEFNGRPSQNFHFDKIFWDPETRQDDVYGLAAKKSIVDVINGYNATIFAYGQTGAGKSWTMFGNIHENHLKGIIPRSCMHIFDHIRRDTEGTEYTIKCSFLEIYKEIIRDLLNPATHGLKQGLKVRETPEKGVWVEGLKEEYVTCEEDVINLILLGEKYRAVSSTKMNASSSRSHSLFILSLHQKSKDGSTKEGRLNLADLAGSEKVNKTGATGETLEEAKKINQSLSALGNCINALTKAKKGHVPYRDSKLTFILRESLGGNCKTTLLVACSPHIFNLEETISTLQFAKRAKSIKNSVKVNKQRSVAELMAIIEKIKKELAYYKKYISCMETLLEQIKGANWKNEYPKIAAFLSNSASVQLENVQNENNDNEEDNDIEDNNSESGNNDNQNISHSGSQRNTPRKKSKPSSRVSEVDLSFKVAELEVEYQKIKESSHLEVRELKEEFDNLKKDNETNLPIKEQKKLQMIENLEYKIHCAKEEIENQNQLRISIEKKFQSDTQLLNHFFENYEKTVNLYSIEIDQHKMKVDYYSANLEEKLAEKEVSAHETQLIQRKLEDTVYALNEKESRLRDLIKERDEFSTLRTQLEKECDELLARQSVLDEKSHSLEQSLLSITQSNKQSDTHLKSVIENNTQLRSVLSERKEKLTELQSSVLEAKEEVLNAKEEQYSSKHADQDKEIEDRQQTVDVEIYKTEVAERDALKSDVDKTTAEIKAIRSEIKQKRDDIDEMKTEHQTKLETLSTEYDANLSAYRLKIELLETNLSDEQSGVFRKLNMLDEKLNNWVSRLLSESLIHSATKDKLESVEKHIAEKENQNEKIKKKNIASERQLSDLQVAYNINTECFQSQAERIEQIERDLENLQKEKYEYQQKVKEALEANIENAKRFEEQLVELAQPTVVSSPYGSSNYNNNTPNATIRVPVRKEESIFSTIFGKPKPFLYELTNSAKFGFLMKRGDWLRRWNQRWFVLQNSTIYYFETNNQSMRASGEIELTGCKVSPAEDVVNKQFSFGIYHPTRKNIFLHTTSDADYKEWLKCIRNAIRQTISIDRAIKILGNKPGMSPRAITNSPGPQSPSSPYPQSPSSPYPQSPYQPPNPQSPYTQSPLPQSPYTPK